MYIIILSNEFTNTTINVAIIDWNIINAWPDYLPYVRSSYAYAENLNWYLNAKYINKNIDIMKHTWNVNDLKWEYDKFYHITYRGAGALLTLTILH